jgi:hypothetical protein
MNFNKESISIFKPTEATVEYEEKTYYDLPPSNDIKEVWFDLIEHLSKGN